MRRPCRTLATSRRRTDHAAPPSGHDTADAAIEINPLYARPGEARTVPKLHLPQGERPPDLAYQIVHDELMLNGNARLNLATFVTTWMEPQTQRLMDESVDKNVIDKDEYPQTAELERRCVHMLGGLWHAPRTIPGPGRPPRRRPQTRGEPAQPRRALAAPR